jgi:hypothetical protein
MDEIEEKHVHLKSPMICDDSLFTMVFVCLSSILSSVTSVCADNPSLLDGPLPKATSCGIQRDECWLARGAIATSHLISRITGQSICLLAT